MGIYLYNGVRRPPLPETTHKYMLIVPETGGNRVYFSPVPFIRLSTSVTTIPKDAGTVTVTYHTIYDGSTEWRSPDYRDLSYGNSIVTTGVWSNHDILFEDGSVYLEASYPIDEETGKEITDYGLYHLPIPILNPTAILMGFLMGKRL